MDQVKKTIFICSGAGDDKRAQINRELMEKNAGALVDAVAEAGKAADERYIDGNTPLQDGAGLERIPVGCAGGDGAIDDLIMVLQKERSYAGIFGEDMQCLWDHTFPAFGGG